MQTVGIGCELQLFPGASVVPKFNSFSLWRPGGVHTCFQFLLLSSPPARSPATSQLPRSLRLSLRKDAPLTHEHPTRLSAQSITTQQRCRPCVLQPAPAGWGPKCPFWPQGSSVCKGLTATCRVPSGEMSNCQLLAGHAGSCLTIELFMMTFSLELSYFHEGFLVKTTIEVVGKG